MNMNLGKLELKLHKVHFADKFSAAKLDLPSINSFLVGLESKKVIIA